MRVFSQVIFFSALALVLMCETATAKWFTVGSPGFSASNLYPSMTVDKNDTPYVVFIDTNYSNSLSAMKYDGSNWVLVGSPGFTQPSIILLSIATDNNGTPYVAFCDDYDYKISVMKFDGSAWVAVGAPGLSADMWGMNLGLRIPFAIDKNGTPYVAAVADIPAIGLRATVVKFDGTDWVVVGNKGFSDSTIGTASLAIDNNGTPYMAFEDEKYGDKATVMKYNGTGWVSVGSKGFTPREAYSPVINIAPNGTPYLSFVDRNKSYRGSVQKFDGTGWVYVGAAGFTSGAGDYITSAIDNNGTPHIVYRSEFTGKAMAMWFDGTNWQQEGIPGFSDGLANFYSMAIDKHNAIYVAYQDYAHDARTTLMKLYCKPQKPAICAAFTDTLIGANMIVWDGSMLEVVDSYRLYREDAGTYKRIGAVPGTARTFTDPTGTPATQSYQYKLTILDSCGRETHIDTVVMHKTMKLAFNYLLNNTASITWNSYGGISNPTYIVKRSNDNGVFTPIAGFAITGSDTTYLDVNPPAGSNRYRIDIALTGPCNTGPVVYNAITSNIVTSWHTGVADMATNPITLAPNPANDQLMVHSSTPVEQVDVYGLTGSKLLSATVNNKNDAVMDVSSLPAGTYLLRVNGLHHAYFIKR